MPRDGRSHEDGGLCAAPEHRRRSWPLWISWKLRVGGARPPRLGPLLQLRRMTWSGSSSFVASAWVPVPGIGRPCWSVSLMSKMGSSEVYSCIPSKCRSGSYATRAGHARSFPTRPKGSGALGTARTACWVPTALRYLHTYLITIGQEVVNDAARGLRLLGRVQAAVIQPRLSLFVALISTPCLMSQPAALAESRPLPRHDEET